LVTVSRAAKLDPVTALAPADSCTFDANSGEHPESIRGWLESPVAPSPLLRWHSAETNFPFRQSFSGVAKRFGTRESFRSRQHAASVRSPDLRVHA